MACVSGTKVVNDGLVFHYDMRNTVKSWKGKPTTNLITSPEIDNTGWGFGIPTNGTDIISSVSYLEDEDGPFVRFSSEVIADRANTWPYMRSPQFTTGSGTFTWSGYYRVQELAPGTSTAAFRASAVVNDYGSSGLVTKGISSSEVDGNWRRFSLTRSLDSGTTYSTGGVARTYSPRFEFYYGAMNVTGEKLVIDFKNIQVEESTFVTPFIDGSRSTTNSLVDLTGNSTITLDSPSYNSDNTFYFNGGTERINLTSIGGSSAFNNHFTISAWVNSTNISATQNILSMNGPYFMRLSGSKVRFNVYAGATPSWLFQNGTTVLSSNTWYYLTMVWDGTANTWTGYINDQQEFSVSKTGPLAGNTNAKTFYGYVGYTPQNGEQSNFFGQIGVVQYYNRSLSASEVKNNFEAMRDRYL